MEKLVCSPQEHTWSTLEMGKLVNSSQAKPDTLLTRQTCLYQKRMSDTPSRWEKLVNSLLAQFETTQRAAACMFITSYSWEMNICVTPQAQTWNILETCIHHKRMLVALLAYLPPSLPGETHQSFCASSPILIQTSSSRSCSSWDARKSRSFTKRWRIPGKLLLMHLFLKLWSTWILSVCSVVSPYLWPWGRPMTWLHFHSRDARMCNKIMPNFQYNKHSLHCFSGSVSNNSNSSTLPMSSIIFLHFSLNGVVGIVWAVDLVEEIVGEGCSRSSSQVHEHDSYQLLSQQNVAIQAF